jgi:parallel beta-helix repeat protein
MRRTIVLFATMALTVLVASGVALAVTKIGSAGAQSSVVGPGESIQKAVNAAHPGDTIVVRRVHREDIIIRKNGIKLRGDDAVIDVPDRPKADSPWSRAFGPEAICVCGGDDLNIETGELTPGPRVSDVSVSGFTIRGLRIKEGLGIDVTEARNTTVVGNRVIGMLSAIGVAGSDNTTVAKNHLIGSPSPETDNDGIIVEDSSRTTVVKNVVRSYPEGQFAIEAIDESRDTTIVGNDFIGNWVGVLVDDSPGTKILSNEMRRSGVAGTIMVGQKSANAKVVGNHISGGGFGMYVGDTKRGSFTGNTIRDNCAGMFFEAFPSQPVGDFEVKANTVEDNTRSCRAAQFDRNFSGIGIALLGASGMEVKGNHLSDNVPSDPTAVSGGVVVAVDPYFDGTIKPRNNSVVGNRFGRNKPDIFWDGSGSGNRFVGNLCNSSVPSRLCN